jgi:hypothetical protein
MSSYRLELNDGIEGDRNRIGKGTGRPPVLRIPGVGLPVYIAFPPLSPLTSPHRGDCGGED